MEEGKVKEGKEIRNENLEKLLFLLNLSPLGVVMQGFITEAVISYAKEMIKNPIVWSSSLITSEMWKECAREVLKEFGEKA